MRVCSRRVIMGLHGETRRRAACPGTSERMKKMSNVQKADPYRKLVRVMIILLVLFVLLLTGYLLLDSYSKGRVEAQQREAEEQQRQVIEANNKMVEEYNKQVLQQRAEAAAAAVAWPEAAATGVDVLSLKGIPVRGEDTIPYTRTELLSGSLMVVNRWHPLPADFAAAEANIVSIMDHTKRRVPTTGRAVSIFPEAATALDQMIAGAKEAGLEYFLIREGFRSMATQTEHWDKETTKYTDRLTGNALTEQVRKTVSYPGTSDYQSGQSVSIDAYSANDPVLNTARFQDTDQAKWLVENAWKYGYVFRFPVMGYPTADTVDKSYKTGINLTNLDAYRYVGIPHAFVMKHKGYCLEEYIEYLIEQQHIAVYQDGVLKYEIFRQEGGDENGELLIPSGGQSHIISSDNMGGIICAITY